MSAYAADNEDANAATRCCQERGHLWGDAYSFGGVHWYRDCVRCFETIGVEQPAQSEQPRLRAVPDVDNAAPPAG